MGAAGTAGAAGGNCSTEAGGGVPAPPGAAQRKVILPWAWGYLKLVYMENPWKIPANLDDFWGSPMTDYDSGNLLHTDVDK